MLAIVPARGGSRGIPGKNLRTLHGKPLICHTLEMLADVPQIQKAYVSTEDPDIAGVCRTRGWSVLERPKSLAGDDVPVAKVAEHVVKQLDWGGKVGVFQPTSPTLAAKTVQHAIMEWNMSGAASACSVTVEPHLLWDTHGPLFENRVNRQNADPLYRETGGFFFAKTVPIGDMDPLIGHPHQRICISSAESIDIDTLADLEAARRVLGRKQIEIRVATGKQVGRGHEYRAQALAQELSHHHVQIVSDRVLRPRFWSGDLVVFDKLDTDPEEVLDVKAAGALAVCLEDLGAGSGFADLVVNELYVDTRPGVLSGPRFAVLRPEFLALPPYEVREGKRVMVCFGGTDPAGLSERIGPLVGLEASPHVVRPGDGTHMAEAMRTADLLVTSAGRTAHEAAAAGVPTITIAANERETRHTHCPGVLRLGHHAAVSDEQIRGCVKRLLRSPEQRKQMSETARTQVDGLGARRIATRIDALLEGL